MDIEKGEMCESLIEWFKTLNLEAPHSTAEELSDGVAFAQALNQFASEIFTETWLSKIKSDIVSNWRLKMSNLKKVIEGIYDYYGDVLNYSLSNYPRPDVMRIAEKSDMVELERLLRLVLGCAVNCNDKENYIKQIMSLEEFLQQNIMKALQELESTWQNNFLSHPTSLGNLNVKVLQEERDNLAQKYFEANKMINLLMEEKSNLQHELSKLHSDADKTEVSYVGGEDRLPGPNIIGTDRYTDLRNTLDNLKEELLQSEASRDDLKIKIQQQEADMTLMQQRIDELTQRTVDFSQLKDEIDVLRESHDKLKTCEAQLSIYMKKLEDYNDLKKHIKQLEERSADYIHQNAHYEEHAKRCATLKGQVEFFKKEIQDLNLKLDEEISKNVKLQFDNKNLESSLNVLQRTKDTLLKERESLREAIDELKCGHLGCSAKTSLGNTMSKELQATTLIEKIHKLEVENKALREGQGGQTALMQLLDDANKRNNSLREQVKYTNERILSLTHISHNDDPNFKGIEFGKQIKHLMDLNEHKTAQLEQSTTHNFTLQSKITQLENTLLIREQELASCEAKHKKCMEKAKAIINNLDPRIVNIAKESKVYNNANLEDEEKSELEVDPMDSTIYRHGSNAQSDSADSKLAIMMGQSRTFLSRQRQSATRKSVTNYKSK